MENHTAEKGKFSEEAGWERSLSQRVSDLEASVEDVKEKIGGRMKTAAGKVRETEPRIEQAIHKTAETVADKLEKGGSYLTDGQIEYDVTSVIRRYPVPSLLVGVAVGLALGAKLRR